MDEQEEIKTEPLKPLFFDNLSANDIVLKSSLKDENTLILSWSGTEDKNVIVKLFNNDGEVLNEYHTQKESEVKVSLSKLNERYLASLQYRGESDLSTVNFWYLDDKDSLGPIVGFPEGHKFFGDEGSSYKIGLSNADFYLKYGSIYSDIYYEGNLVKTIEIDQLSIEDGVFKFFPTKEASFGKFSVVIRGVVGQLDKEFNTRSDKFYFLPEGLSKKLRLKNEELNYEIELDDEN